MENLTEFNLVSASSGINNASRKLYKSFVENNGLQKVKGDKRQNFLFDGNLYGVSVNTRDTTHMECRQFDEDYVGFICLDLNTNRVMLTTKFNTKVKGNSLVRSKGNKKSTSVVSTKSVEVDVFTIFS